MYMNQPYRSRSYSNGNPPLSRYVSDQYISLIPCLRHQQSQPPSFGTSNGTGETPSSFPNHTPPAKKRLHSYQGHYSPYLSNWNGHNRSFRATSLPPHSAPYQKSIVASLDMLAPLEDPACPCEHYGAQWEDCRIVIHCFGFKQNGHKRATTTCTNTRINDRGNKNSPHLPPTYRQTQQLFVNCGGNFPSIHLDTRTPNNPVQRKSRNQSRSVCARSVRLSIVPLNPIYKRIQDHSPRPVGFKTSKYFGKRGLSQQTFVRYWKKRLIQRMAFKIDDFTIQEDQVKAAKDVFKRFDKRGQDKISTTDLGPAFRALNLTVKPDTLKEWADQVDDDATGFIDFNGFLICYGKKLQEDQDERDLRDAFRVLDKNKRGEIDVEDLRWILKGLGDDLTEEEIDDMIRDTDTDGSGFVDFDEFYKLMTSE